MTQPVDGCSDCRGLPEERAIVAAGLAQRRSRSFGRRLTYLRGTILRNDSQGKWIHMRDNDTHACRLAVVAISSVDRRSKCWGEVDGPLVSLALAKLVADHPGELDGVPVFAFGARRPPYRRHCAPAACCQPTFDRPPLISSLLLLSTLLFLALLFFFSCY